MRKVAKRKFVAYFHFVSWDCISLGLHVSLRCPNIELHLPFGFIRIGWSCTYEVSTDGYIRDLNKSFGIGLEKEKTKEGIRRAFS